MIGSGAAAGIDTDHFRIICPRFYYYYSDRSSPSCSSFLQWTWCAIWNYESPITRYFRQTNRSFVSANHTQGHCTLSSLVAAIPRHQERARRCCPRSLTSPLDSHIVPSRWSEPGWYGCSLLCCIFSRRRSTDSGNRMHGSIVTRERGVEVCAKAGYPQRSKLPGRELLRYRYGLFCRDETCLSMLWF